MDGNGIDFDRHLATETEKLIDTVASAVAEDQAVLSRTVPSCPDWTVADLVWHISEVQDFWTYILTTGADGPSRYQRPTRPNDDQVVDFLDSRLTNLKTALERPDSEACWSWSKTGGTVAWVRRRQAQEALIHRLDAELAVDATTTIDEALAQDGVDEMLTVMLGAASLPDWAEFSADESQILLVAGARHWQLETGRLSGQSPDGHDMDQSAVRLLSSDKQGNTSATNVTTVTGTGADINLWLWGRSDRSALLIDGNEHQADNLRSIAAEVTSL